MLDPKITTFILGMVCTLTLLGLLVLAGPRLMPNQLDKCWVELQRNVPNCSTRIVNGVTSVRDARCVRPSEGLLLVADGDTGWYKVQRATPKAKPSTPSPAKSK